MMKSLSEKGKVKIALLHLFDSHGYSFFTHFVPGDSLYSFRFTDLYMFREKPATRIVQTAEDLKCCFQTRIISNMSTCFPKHWSYKSTCHHPRVYLGSAVLDMFVVSQENQVSF